MFRRSSLLVLFAAVLFAAPKEPIRLLVVTNSAQILPQANEAFQKTYGNNLLDLTIKGDDVSPGEIGNADAIFTSYISIGVLQRLAPAMRAARGRGTLLLTSPVSASEREWNLKLDPKVNDPAEQYWKMGGVENLTAFLAYVYRAAGGNQPIKPPPPVSQVGMGIYHPGSRMPFASLTEYLEWYGKQRLIPLGAPLAGILLYSTNYKSHDLAHIDALIRELEKRGIGAVAAFGWPISAMDRLLAIEGKCPLRVLFALNLTIYKPEDSPWLEKYGVHVINLLSTRQSLADWEKDMRGVGPDRVPFLLNAPERAGASEPIMFATFEDVPGTQTKVTKAIPDRLDAAVRRAQRWIVLQDKTNADKHIALIYYNNPPGRGNLGASYLAIFPSMVKMLKRLQQAGYNTGSALPDERQLIDLLERNGRNVELWAPGELEDMVNRGGLTLVSMKKYRTWFAKLPKRYREATIARWGEPEKSTLMTITSRDKEKYFVIPGIRFGNIFVGPQPLRSTFAEAMTTAHDPVTPVPHQYVAAYLWYRYEFKADAITHIGRHGTLEWLPGKQVGQAGWDSSEVLLDDVPDPYYYIMDGGGEAIQAKRRGAAVLISHLTPLLVAGGEQEQFRKLHEAFDNIGKTESTAPNLAREYREQALAEIRRLKLDGQLGMDLRKLEWAEVSARVERFLHDSETDPIPMGIHTPGTLPPEPVQREALAELIKYNFQESEAKQFAPELKGWADAIFENREPEVSRNYPAVFRDRIQTTLGDAKGWLSRLRQSPQMELDGLITVLSGRYLPSGLLGDPLRTQMALPTGRNLHAFDGALIPTKAAWSLGKKMADQMIAKYRKEKGALPEKVSMVLWYGETERHQGAMESMAFCLMGVEPQWNPRGIVDGFRLIPDAELGRARIDVLFTISGIYRDGFGDKLLLLDKAVRLAASAGNNPISRHDREAAEALKREGTDAALADKISRARVFSTKPGHYGIGVVKMVEQSKDADGHTDDLGNLYLHYMNYAFSSEIWGETAPKAIDTQLKGNQAVLFSRSTNLYGALDNDDTYQYVGGLNVATKTVNRAAPQFYIHNLRKSGSESVVDMKTWLANELNARDWNPKWIKEMQRSGYAGAREMFKEMEHLYGFQATSAEQIDGTFWQNSYDVFIKDKHGLNMQEFFEKNNPHAQQWILSRMIEVDRQGSYKFSDADRADLIRRYVGSVNKYGVTCSANTCGNLKVHQFIAEQAPLISGLGNRPLRQFGQTIAHATGWKPRDFQSAPAAVRAGIAAAAPKTPPRTGSQARPEAPVRPSLPYVSGFRMQEKALLGAVGTKTAPMFAFACLGAIMLLMCLGAGLEASRGRP